MYLFSYLKVTNNIMNQSQLVTNTVYTCSSQLGAGGWQFSPSPPGDIS